MFSLSKEQSIIPRETIKECSFQNYAPFSTWTFYPLSSTPKPSVGSSMLFSYGATDKKIVSLDN